MRQRLRQPHGAADDVQGHHHRLQPRLQEDKRHLFAAYDIVDDAMAMAVEIVATASFNEKRISAGLDRGFLDATSLAEYLVTRGVPFRTSHQVVGSLVRRCEAEGLDRLADLPLDAFNTACAKAGQSETTCEQSVYDWLGAANVVRRYRSAGNGGVSGFEQQLQAWRDRLAR